MPHTGGIQRKLSKLQAVNIILRGAREHPVSSLDDDTTNETIIAEQVLDEWSLQHQAIGLFNNTFEQTLSPATVASTGITIGDIILPPNTLSARSWGPTMRHLIDAREDEGNLKLYDLEDETFDFSALASITLLLILFLDFDDLSALQQRAVTDQAANEYQMAVVGSREMNRMLESRGLRSRAEAKAENIRKMRPNLFSNSRSNIGKASVRGVIRPWWAEGDGRAIFNRRF